MTTEKICSALRSDFGINATPLELKIRFETDVREMGLGEETLAQLDEQLVFFTTDFSVGEFGTATYTLLGGLHVLPTEKLAKLLQGPLVQLGTETRLGRGVQEDLLRKLGESDRKFRKHDWWVFALLLGNVTRFGLSESWRETEDPPTHCRQILESARESIKKGMCP